MEVRKHASKQSKGEPVEYIVYDKENDQAFGPYPTEYVAIEEVTKTILGLGELYGHEKAEIELALERFEGGFGKDEAVLTLTGYFQRANLSVVPLFGKEG
jgi:hypothetical protein